MPTVTTQAKGRKHEKTAAQLLSRHRYRIVERNFLCRLGEIDLIALDPENTLVFVEVRYRANLDYGGPLASVTPTKQGRVRRSAQFFLLSHARFKHHSCRFDVIGITGQRPPANEPKIEWIKSAFM